MNIKKWAVPASIALVFGLAGWGAGRYLTPVSTPDPSIPLPQVKTAPPFPEQIPGFTPGEEQTGYVRVTDSGGVIDSVPTFQNHCGMAMFTFRWRSIGGSVRVTLGEKDLGVDEAGLVVTSGACEQPKFYSTESNTLRDVIVEYIMWTAKP